MSEPLVSVIMPAYNAGNYIEAAIQSVLEQNHSNFELVIINDGSTDKTKEIIQTFSDTRINYFEQTNKGVSAARNVGLDNMNGDYFCFLDADDMLTKDSLNARLKAFEKNPEVTFVDGVIHKVDTMGMKVIDIWRPKFQGNPLADLLRLTGHSFFGPSWMIRSSSLKDVRFKEGQTHAEDLLFYMKLARDTQNTYLGISNVILKYRMHYDSAMSRGLKFLQKGYEQVYDNIKTWSEVPENLKKYYRKKTLSIMIKSYLRSLQIKEAAAQLVKRLAL